MPPQSRRPLSDDEWGMLMICLAAAALAVTLLLMSGCSALPKTITIRDPAGNMLAHADPESGDITLTWHGLNSIRPRIVLPEKK